MKSKLLLAGFVLGWAGLLVVKYGVVGLRAWNGALHPGRTDSPADMTRFGSPLLGIFSK